MPTKTRLDPTAGGETPPAGQDGAQGSGRGDHSTSASPAAALPGDVAGFIDVLGALATHVRERELFEAAQRRGWAQMAAVSGVMAALVVMNAFFTGATAAFGSASDANTFYALFVSGLLTAGLSMVGFLLAAWSPWRESPDSVDRVALRHEDSPLRDRIRISQWILFDTVFTRFTFNERRVNAVIAQGVLAISAFSVLATALLAPLEFALPRNGAGASPAASLCLAVFLVLVLVSILLISRAAKAAFANAQHYGRQVLAFDADFGGFLARAEKERVEAVVNAAGGKAAPAHMPGPG